MKNYRKLMVLFFVFLSFQFILSTKHYTVETCDTWVALANASKTGNVIFAKNSDRTAFDCQPLMFYPGKKWEKGSEINLGRISIPQMKETYATMGSSPYWCWGYEEGINEYGVVIGNEGVFTRILIEEIAAAQAGKNPPLGPTGMDLLRLGLERGKTARESLDAITGLVEKYGQFGSGLPTYNEAGAYHNSYIIADPDEAWILETAGKQWIARQLKKGVASISNKLSITNNWDLSSKDLVNYAVKKGWWQKENKNEFNFTEAYSVDTPMEKMRSRRAQIRSDCSLNLLLEKEGEVDLHWMKRIARDRSTFPSLDLEQTASSCVAILPKSDDELPVFWWCPSVPSNSCYIPFFIHGSGLPKIVSKAGTVGKCIVPPSKIKADSFSPDSYWWLFRDLSNLIFKNREERNPVVRAEFDKLENSFNTELPAIMKSAVELRKSGKTGEATQVLDKFTERCLDQVLQTVNDLRRQLKTEADKKN